MVNLKDDKYSNLRKVWGNSNSDTYRASFNLSGFSSNASGKTIKPVLRDKNVLVRYFKDKQMAGPLVDRLVCGHRVLDSLGIVEASQLVSFGDDYIVFNDGGGYPFSEYLEDVQCSERNKFNLFVKVAGALGVLHSAGVSHGNLELSSILINPISLKITIINLENAVYETRHQSKFNALMKKHEMLGAGEQKGDKRVFDESVQHDLSDLGILFKSIYRFASTGRNKEKIPGQIIKIFSVLDLNNSTNVSEGGYTNVENLIRDLKYYQDFYEKFQFYPELSLNQSATKNDSLRYPLVARNREMSLLNETFSELSAERGSILLIKGAQGLGKSRLMSEFENTLTSDDLFLRVDAKDSGKKESYSVIRAVSTKIIELMESRDETISNKMRSLLKWEFGDHNKDLLESTSIANDIGNLVTIVESLIGTVLKLVNRLCIVVDNIEQSDEVSLEVLERITSSMGYLFLIGLTGDKIIEPASVVSSWGRAATRYGEVVQSIELAPLSFSEVTSLVTRLFYPTDCSINKLSELIYRKTKGNPSLICGFLNAHYVNGYVQKNLSSNYWYWNIDTLENTVESGSFIDLNDATMNQLSVDCQKMLQLLSSFELPFSEKQVEALFKGRWDHDNLTEAVSSGILVVLNDSFGFKDVSLAGYAFRDKHFKGFLYSLLSVDKRKIIHKEIAERMVDDSRAFSQKDNKAWHYNLCYGNTVDESEQYVLVFANYNVAKHYVIEQDWESAFQYSEKAYLYSFCLIGQCSSEAGVEQGDGKISLAYEIALNHINVQYYIGNDAEALDLCLKVSDLARTEVEKAKLSDIKVKVLIHNNQYDEAISEGLTALRALGFIVPRKPKLYHVAYFRMRVGFLFWGKKFDRLMPESKAELEGVRLAYSISASVLVTCFQHNLLYVPLLSLAGILFAKKHGVAPESSVHMLGYALLKHISNRGRISPSGYVDAAEKINEEFPDYQLGRVVHSFVKYGLIHPWENHAKSSEQPLLEAFRQSLKAGEVEMAGYISGSYFCLRVLRGVNLEHFLDEINQTIPTIASLNHALPVKVHALLRETVDYLVQETPDIDESYLDVKETNDAYADNESILFESYFLKTFLMYALGDYNKSKTFFYRGILPGILGGAGLPYKPAFSLYGVLAVIKSTSKYFPFRLLLWAHPIVLYVLTYFFFWTKISPENFKHKYHLVKAEMYSQSVLTRWLAGNLYRKALSASMEADNMMEYAVICERFGLHMLSKTSNMSIASSMLRKAIDTYQELSLRSAIPKLESHLAALGVDTRYIGFEEKILSLSDEPSEKEVVAGVSKSLGKMFQVARIDYFRKKSGRWLLVSSGDVGEMIQVNELADVSYFGKSFSSFETAISEKNILVFDKRESSLSLFVPMFSEHIQVVVGLRGVRLKRLSKERVRALELLRRDAEMYFEHIAVNEKSEDLQQKIEDLNEDIAKLNHEMRTPLNGLVGCTGLARERLTLLGVNDAELDRYFELMSTSVNDLSLLNTNVLDYYQISLGEKQPVSIGFNMGSNVSDCVDSLQARFDSYSVELKPLKIVNIPEICLGDGTLVKQVVNNFLDNALKFTPKGGVVFCEIKGYCSNGIDLEVIIKVSDTGVGIPEGDIDNIFTKGEKSDNRKLAGLGYGLSLVKGFAELMGGTAYATSTPGVGTDMYALFYVKVGSASDLPEDEVPRKKELHFYQDTIALVADDSLINREIIKGLLNQINIRSHEAESGLEVVSLCASMKYDLVFMDIWMPGLDGLQASKEVRRNSLCSDSPIIAVSATHLSANDMESSGIDDFLLKPLDESQFFESVAHFLGGSEVMVMEDEALVKIEQDIAGIDLKILNNRLASNYRIVHTGLSLLGEEFTEAEKIVENAIADKESHLLLQGVVHNLKGHARNIGASRLGLLSEEVYEDFHRSVSPNSVQINEKLLTDLLIQIGVVRESSTKMLAILNSVEQTFESQAPGSNELDEANFGILERDLKNRSLYGAKKTYKKIKSFVVDKYKVDGEALENCMVKGDFTGALIYLDRIKTNYRSNCETTV